MDMINRIYNSLYQGDRTQSSKESQSASQVNSRPVDGRQLSLANLNPGDVFKGEIVDIKNSDVTIQLANGGKVSAHLGESVPLNIGDSLFFQVKENNLDQLFISPMPNQEMRQMSAIAERALLANGLSLSEKNGKIAMALMDAGEPLDKANIMKLIQQSYKYPEADSNTLVSMNKQGIPVTEGNIRSYEQFMDNTHQISDQVANMADTAVTELSSFAENESIADLISLNNEFMNIINADEALDNAGSLAMLENTQTEVTEAETLATQGQIQAEPKEAQQKPVTSEELMLKFTNDNIKLSGDNALEMLKTFADEGYDLKEAFDMFQNANSNEELLGNLSKNLMNMSEDGIRKLLKSDGYKELLSDSIKEAWSLDPREMRSPKELDELYDKLKDDTRKLAEHFEGKGNDSFSKQGGQMREQMKFVQDLNNNFIYTQVPVKLDDQMNNSELYVYADKKKLAEKRDSVSVLLHLDMENLGPTDVHLSMTGENVHAIFYLQDQRSVKLVASNMNELSDKLKEKGLTLSDEVVKRAEPKKSPVVEEIIDPNAEKSVKRYTFDVRS